MSFASLGKFIPKHFILFVAMVNGIVSLISLPEFSLLVYRNARDLEPTFTHEQGQGRWRENWPVR